MGKTPWKSSYLKAITTLVSGSVIAQVFTLICSPILTRICSPEDLGIYSLVTGAVTMFGTIMSLRYEICIVSEPEEEKVWPLIKLSALLCIALSIIIACGYLIYFYLIDINAHFILLALATGLLVLLMGFINIVTAFNNRQQDYKLITKTYVVRVFCQNVCNLIASFIGTGAVGLSFSQFIGYVAGVRGQVKPMLKHKDRILHASSKEIKAVACDNRKQALVSAPATLANGLSYSLINYFIEALFTTTVVGYYSISYRILGLPATIISTNVSRVFLEKASREHQEKGHFKKSYLYTVAILAAIGVPIGAVMILAAPKLCELVFGHGWGVAGVYIRLLTPMFILRFIAGGVNCAAIIVNKQQYDFFIQTLLTIAVVGLFIYASANSLSIETFLIWINLAFSVIYIAYLLLFWRCACMKAKNGKE